MEFGFEAHAHTANKLDFGRQYTEELNVKPTLFSEKINPGWVRFRVSVVRFVLFRNTHAKATTSRGSSMY